MITVGCRRILKNVYETRIRRKCVSSMVHDSETGKTLKVFGGGKGRGRGRRDRRDENRGPIDIFTQKGEN